MAQLIVLLSVSALSSSCILPLTLHYYVPSAEGVTVRSTSCSGDPPYMASMLGERFDLMVSLAQRSLTGIHDPILTVIIDPFPAAQIAVDPTLIGILANGQSVQSQYIRYYLGKSGAAPALDAHGPIDIRTDYLIIDLPLSIGGTLDVVTYLPPIKVDGQEIQFPDVSFKLEKHTKLIMIAGNC